MAARVLVVDSRYGAADLLVRRLRESPDVGWCARAPDRDDWFNGEQSSGLPWVVNAPPIDTVVYAPPLTARKRLTPDLANAKTVFGGCARAGVKSLVLLSSAAIYGASSHPPGLLAESCTPVGEGHNFISDGWTDLEALAVTHFGGKANSRLTILRAVPVLAANGADYFSEMLGAKVAPTLPGYDPSLQLLSAEDLARAVCCAVAGSGSGIYDLAPEGVIPLRAALRLARVWRLPVPHSVQKLARGALAPVGLAHPAEQLDFIRYSQTVSNRRIKRDLGFTPTRSTAAALIEWAGQARASVAHAAERRRAPKGPLRIRLLRD